MADTPRPTALQLEHSCPQCGGPITIEETARLIACPFCRVKHFIHAREHFSYHILPRSFNPSECVYVPYWRLRGMEVVLGDNALQSSIVDANIVALASAIVPPSLGYRTQTMKLRFVLPNTPGVFLKPAFDRKEFEQRLSRHRSFMSSWSPFEKSPADETAREVARIARSLQATDPRRAAQLLSAGSAVKRDQTAGRDVTNGAPAGGQNSERRSFIGETVSLIYLPVYSFNGKLFDGVTDEVLAATGANGIDGLGEREDPAGFALSFLPTLCPGCGWDMEGASDSLALSCSHCMSVWRPEKDRWERMDFALWPSPDSAGADLWMPFWRLGGDWAGLRLQSFADLVRFTRMPRAVAAAMEEQRVYYWLPAFKIETERFILLGKLLTGAQTEPQKTEVLPTARIYPVTMSLSEAFDAVRVLLGSLCRARKPAVSELYGATFTLTSSTLVYVPFVRRNFEYVQPGLNAAIHVNTLKWAAGM